MTEKSLSEKICEECGIKPLYKVKHFNGITEVWSPAFDKEELRFAKAHKQILEQKEVYPDFEKNNDNFVHLMELEIPYKNNETITLFNISEYYVEQYIPRKKVDYLICLLTFLTDSENDKSKMSKVKEIIREATWEV